MPLLQVIRNRIAPAPTGLNTYAQTVADLGGSHFWNFEELSGTFADSIGSLTLQEKRGDGVGRGLPGAVKGEPRVYAVSSGQFNSGASNDRYLTNSAAVSTFARGDRGAIGGFIKRGQQRGSQTTDILFAPLDGIGNADNSFSFEILSNGRLRLVCRGIAPQDGLIATSDFPVYSGAEWRHVIASQPKDGGGIRFYVNGLPVPTTTAVQGAGSVDDWITEIEARSTSGFSSIQIMGRNAANDSTRDYFTRISGLFYIGGSTISDADALSIFNSAAITAGVFTSFEEWAQELDSNELNLQGPRIWGPQWCTSGSDSMLFAVEEPKRMSTGGYFDLGVNDWNKPPPSSIPGFAYGKVGYRPGRNTLVGTVQWSENVTLGNWVTDGRFQNTTGTLFLVATLRPTNFASRTIYHLGNLGTSHYVQVETESSGRLRCIVRDGGSNYYLRRSILSIDSYVTPGDEFTAAFVQDGTGIRMFINGSELVDGVDSEEVLSGTGAVDWWHHIPEAGWGSNPTVCIGGDRSANYYDADIWSFIDCETVLSADEIAEVHDLIFGNVTEIPRVRADAQVVLAGGATANGSGIMLAIDYSLTGDAAVSVEREDFLGTTNAYECAQFTKDGKHILTAESTLSLCQVFYRPQASPKQFFREISPAKTVATSGSGSQPINYWGIDPDGQAVLSTAAGTQQNPGGYWAVRTDGLGGAVEETLTLADTSGWSNTGAPVFFSRDGQIVLGQWNVIGTARRLGIRERTGPTSFGALLQPSFSTNTGQPLAMRADDDAVLSIRSSTLELIQVTRSPLAIASTASWSDTTLGGIQSAAFSPDGEYLAVSSSSVANGTTLHIYKRSGFGYNLLAKATAFPNGPDITNTLRALQWDPTGTYLHVFGANRNLVMPDASLSSGWIMFERSGDAFEPKAWIAESRGIIAASAYAGDVWPNAVVNHPDF